MPEKKILNRREQFLPKHEGEKLDPTPVEIPLGQEPRGKSIEQQIQEQIAIQIAKKTQPQG